MPEPSPLFSVIIPTYNRAHLIGRAIESVLRQEFGDFEVLVVDDGSKDHTEQVVKTFTDPRVQYYKKENGERGAARNYGTVRARGFYVNFFDSDDLLRPHHLTVARKMIAERNEPEIFHLGYDFQNENGIVVKMVNDFDARIKKRVLFENLLSCNGVFLKKEIAVQFPFREDRVLASSEDWELWIRIVSRFSLQYTNEITSSVVNHDFRSLKTVSINQVIARDSELIRFLQQDAAVMTAYGQSFHRFIAERYTFFMLCLAMQNQKGSVFHWAWEAFRNYPLILFTERFLASIKKVVRPW